MEDLLDAKQLADKLHITIQTLARWRVEGCGPEYINVGRRIVYSPRAVERWLVTRRRSSTSSTIE